MANTVKRALLIWLSILVFHNPVTFLSGVGTLIVIFGVILYNEGKDREKKVIITKPDHSNCYHMERSLNYSERFAVMDKMFCFFFDKHRCNFIC